MARSAATPIPKGDLPGNIVKLKQAEAVIDAAKIMGHCERYHSWPEARIVCDYRYTKLQSA